MYIFTNTLATKSFTQYEADPNAKRLYDDLLSNYNRLIRPVVNNSETLTVWLGLKLSQLIEVVGVCVCVCSIQLPFAMSSKVALHVLEFEKSSNDDQFVGGTSKHFWIT